MDRFLSDYLYNNRMTAVQFFKNAYTWKYGNDVESVYDAMMYQKFFTIPIYAQEYIKFLQVYSPYNP